MKKLHAGSGRPQGVLHKGGFKPRIYATHGGTDLPQGKVHEGVAPRQYGLHGGTALPQGVLSGKKRK